jgi:hypothetical protein
MFRKGSLVAILCLMVWTSVAAATPLWTNVDSSFKINNPLDTNPANPKAYTISVTNLSANVYTDVHFIIPFHWTSSNTDPSKFADFASEVTASTWNNGGQKWDNGSASIILSGWDLFTTMSDTNISPLLVGDPSFPSVTASISSTDSVPNYLVGNFAPFGNAGDTQSFTVTINFTPGFIKSEFEGYFVVPEPGALALSALTALGLLLHRRRAARAL